LRRLFAVAFVLCLSVPALAAAASPLDYTRGILEQATAIVASPRTHNQKLEALASLLKKFLDTDAMGRAALGAHWSSFTTQQSREFLFLFREMMQRAYVQKLLLFDNPTFDYIGQSRVDGEVLVDTAIVTPKDKFQVIYRLRPQGEEWMATGIEVEGVSLTANLGNQFNRLFSKMSPAEVLDLMRRKFGVRTHESLP
jgi:ABC-type transporter MlaC component